MEDRMKNVKQAHGLTHSQMEKLHQDQIHGDVKTMAANNAGDNIKDEYFKKQYADYRLPVTESHVYHLVAEARMFRTSSVSPERISDPIVHKLTVEMFNFMEKGNYFKGQVTHILHNPTFKNVKAEKDEDVGDQDGNVKSGAGTDMGNVGTAPVNTVGTEPVNTGTTGDVDPDKGGQDDQKGDDGGFTDEQLEGFTVAELKDLFSELTGAQTKATKKADIIAEIKSIPKN